MVIIIWWKSFCLSYKSIKRCLDNTLRCIAFENWRKTSSHRSFVRAINLNNRTNGRVAIVQSAANSNWTRKNLGARKVKSGGSEGVGGRSYGNEIDSRLPVVRTGRLATYQSCKSSTHLFLSFFLPSSANFSKSKFYYHYCSPSPYSV